VVEDLQSRHGVHPSDEASGVVPGVAASDRGPRFSQWCGGEEGLDCFSLYLFGVLLVIFQDSCASATQDKVLFCICTHRLVELLDPSGPYLLKKKQFTVEA
jgi:hypothetical protein